MKIKPTSNLSLRKFSNEYKNWVIQREVPDFGFTQDISKTLQP
jgi:hypothetical protein